VRGYSNDSAGQGGAPAVSVRSPGSDPRLLLRLSRRPGYLAALALLGAGLLLAILALRSLPLFVVQAGRASSLGVTALLSVLLLDGRLNRAELLAVLSVAAGLVTLALSAGPQEVADVGTGVRLAMIAAVVIIAVAAVVAARRPAGARSGLALAVLAGLCFALLALGARIIGGFAPQTLLADPAAWAMGLAGLLGLLLSATALQRASAVAATAALVGTETVCGALLGVVVCGDRPQPGSTGYAVAGFVTVLAGALGLARFGAPAEATLTGDATP